jgi:hypothetical protein
VFKKTKILGSLLKHSSRAPTDKCNQQHIVYKAPCQCYKAFFGASKRKMGTRLKEHQSQCKLADRTNKVKKVTYNDTGLSLHHRNENHEFQWEDTTILEIERDLNWRLLEAIHIYKNNDIADLCILSQIFEKGNVTVLFTIYLDFSDHIYSFVYLLSIFEQNLQETLLFTSFLKVIWDK